MIKEHSLALLKAVKQKVDSDKQIAELEEQRQKAKDREVFAPVLEFWRAVKDLRTKIPPNQFQRQRSNLTVEQCALCFVETKPRITLRGLYGSEHEFFVAWGVLCYRGTALSKGRHQMEAEKAIRLLAEIIVKLGVEIPDNA